MKKKIIAIMAYFLTISCTEVVSIEPIDPVYEVTLSGYNPRLEYDGSLIRYRLATLEKDGVWVEEQVYKEEYIASYSYSASSITKELAEKYDGYTITHHGPISSSLSLRIGNDYVSSSVVLSNCTSVSFEENGKTYCHPDFPVEGAETLLDNWDVHPNTIKMNIDEDNFIITFTYCSTQDVQILKIKIIN